MNIVIFGATGLVGKELVKQALLDGHYVKAYGRNVFSEDMPNNDQLTLIQGALFDGGQVLHAIQGCDVVLSALGGGIDGTDKTRSLGIKNIIEQMTKAGIRRIIAVGGLGVLNFDEENLLIDQENYPAAYVPVGKEHQKAFEYLQASTLNWTFVCPPDILSAPATGSFTTSKNYPPQINNYAINAGDLALFMLKEMELNQFVHCRVGISNE